MIPYEMVKVGVGWYELRRPDGSLCFTMHSKREADETLFRLRYPERAFRYAEQVDRRIAAAERRAA